MTTPSTCPKCGGSPASSMPMEKFDAYWCARCDVWLEEACTDATCEFCPGRPAHPSEVPEGQRGSWTGEQIGK